jgi:hypothetical protein
VLLPSFRVLGLSGVPLSTPSLVNGCEDANVGRMVGNAFSEMTHFGNTQFEEGRYWATPLGHELGRQNRRPVVDLAERGEAAG